MLQIALSSDDWEFRRVALQELLPKYQGFLTVRVAGGGNLPKISARAPTELVAAVAERHQTGTAIEKGCILDQFGALTALSGPWS